MLLLARRIGQDLVIYDDAGMKIEIKLVGIVGSYAKYGITAPDNIHVDRKEVYIRKLEDSVKKVQPA